MQTLSLYTILKSKNRVWLYESAWKLSGLTFTRTNEEQEKNSNFIYFSEERGGWISGA